MTAYAIEGPEAQKLARLVEESTRASKEGVRFFIEPGPGVLARAISKRHHIVFGRRGSGKSSLLQKAVVDLTISRTPIAYVDLEEFKGHTYPDVLVSVLVKTFTEFKRWLDTAATSPASKKRFWQKFFGATPEKKAFNKKETAALSADVEQIISALFRVLGEGSTKTEKIQTASDRTQEAKEHGGGKLIVPGGMLNADLATGRSSSEKESREIEYISTKVEVLHQNIMTYKKLFERMSDVAGGPSFLLLDDLYHLRFGDQAAVLDYFHRISKGSNLWLKVGTIRHRSRWYTYGRPPVGMKLGDDADEIDLDVTLEKYDLTKRFLLQILDGFCEEAGAKLDDILADGGKDRLVIASGGVARDFLTIFRRALDVARERLARHDFARGQKVGAEDVNVAAGEFDKFKREDFVRDTSAEDVDKLTGAFDVIVDFCVNKSKANCFLMEKDVSPQLTEEIDELVDLKFIHRARSRVTVRGRTGKIFDAFMLDLSQYTGERARKNFELIGFWQKEAQDSLRKPALIFSERA